MMFVWWRDVIREGTFEGQHTFIVQKGVRTGVSSPYLIMCQLFMLARLQIGLYVLFYLTVLLQLLSAYNLSLVLFVLWCAFLLAYTLELNIGYCDKAFLNVVRDATLSAFIFLGSAFWYIQAWKAKIINLKQQIYHLLSKLQASLEAKIALINANDSIVVKTAITVLLLTAIALFAYWWLGGGGDDSESKDKGNPIDSISSNSSKGSSVGSEAESNASTVGANIFDSTLTIDDSVVDAVSHSVLTYLGLFVGYNDLSITQTKTFLVEFRASVTELKEILGTNLEDFSERTLKNKLDAIKGILGALDDVQRKLNKVTVKIADEIRVNDLQRGELNNLAEQLFKLLDSQSEFTLTSDNEFPTLCSVGLFFYMLTEGRRSISDLKSIFKSSINEVCKLLKEYLANKNHLSNAEKEAPTVVRDFLKDTDCFFKSFDFWDRISKAGEHISASKFFKRFEYFCQKIRV
jgi:hypothetical protein